jgi:hypothetical protein
MKALRFRYIGSAIFMYSEPASSFETVDAGVDEGVVSVVLVEAPEVQRCERASAAPDTTTTTARSTTPTAATRRPRPVGLIRGARWSCQR